MPSLRALCCAIVLLASLPVLAQAPQTTVPRRSPSRVTATENPVPITPPGQHKLEQADLEALMVQHKDLAYELLWTFVRTLSARLRETNDKIKAFFALSARF